MPQQKIYKVMPCELWRSAVAKGSFGGSPVDVADGFIHFSSGEQLKETVAKHFAGQNDLVLLAVDASVFGDSLKWEPSRGGDLFPHLYGDLPTSAVTDEYDLPVGEDGQHVFPELID